MSSSDSTDETPDQKEKKRMLRRAKAFIKFEEDVKKVNEPYHIGMTTWGEFAVIFPKAVEIAKPFLPYIIVDEEDGKPSKPFEGFTLNDYTILKERKLYAEELKEERRRARAREARDEKRRILEALKQDEIARNRARMEEKKRLEEQQRQEEERARKQKEEESKLTYWRVTKGRLPPAFTKAYERDRAILKGSFNPKDS